MSAACEVKTRTLKSRANAQEADARRCSARSGPKEADE
jgi:hypothetical protein